MASTGVRLGHGTIVRIGRGSTPTWTTLTGCEDVALPDFERADEDVTNMGSGGHEEFIPGLMSAPDWSVTKHWVPEDAQDTLLRDLLATGEEVLLEITPPSTTPTARTYQGYVKKWAPTAPMAGKMTGELVMKINAEVEE